MIELEQNKKTLLYASAILQCFFTHQCNKHFVKKSCQRIVISILSKKIVIHIFSRIVQPYCVTECKYAVLISTCP